MKKKSIFILLGLLILINIFPAYAEEKEEAKKHLFDYTATEIFNEYLETVKDFDTNADFQYVFGMYSLVDYHYSKYLDRDIEEYRAMSDLDKYICQTTYIVPMMAFSYSNYDRYLGSADNFRMYTINMELDRTLSISKAHWAAYYNLMSWQYEYFQNNDTFFDFLSIKEDESNGNVTARGDKKVTTNKEEPKKEEEPEKKEDEEKTPGKNPESEKNENNIENNKGNSTNNEVKESNFFKDNILTIIILIIVIIALVIIFIVKKTKRG